IGVELAEQRAKHRLLVKFNLNPGSPHMASTRLSKAMLFGPVMRFISAGEFSGHALLLRWALAKEGLTQSIRTDVAQTRR
ncbi:MAG: hypothetical protein B7Y74_14940, partial [Novosphingobium sp. 35-62-5]